MKLSKPLTQTAIALAISHALTVPAFGFTRDVDNVEALRQAILDANMTPGPDTINLTADIDITGPSTSTGNAVPFITSEITINGNDHAIRRVQNDEDPTPDFRIMAAFLPGSPRNDDANLVLNNVILEGGFLNGFKGAGLFVQKGATVTLNSSIIRNNTIENGDGGGVFVDEEATVILNETRISGNSVTNGNGGGIYSSGNLTIEGQESGSTSIDLNTVTDGHGGGISLGQESTVEIREMRVYSNTVTNGNGGGIHSAGSLTVEGGKITNNVAELGKSLTGTGGGVYSSGSIATLIDIDIYENSARSGGGIFGRAGEVTINDSLISNNVARDSGGGLFIGYSATAVLSETTVSENTVTNGRGGGIYSLDSEVNLSDITISGNTASSGGGVASFTCDLTIIDSLVSNNVGGGIFVTRESITLQNSTITENTNNSGFVAGGGGIAIVESNSTINNVDITNNMSLNGSGGGISFEIISDEEYSLDILNSTISSNSATFNGGGIIINAANGTINIKNSTVSQNTTVNGDGAGAFIRLLAYAEILNTTFSGNSGAINPLNKSSFVNGGETRMINSIIAGSNGLDCSDNSDQMTVQHSIIEDGSCSSPRNVNTRAIYPRLGPLADNGGPTMTHALLAGSPAINAGSADDCPSDDQRGELRDDGACDIGAFERKPTDDTDGFTVIPLADGRVVVIPL